MNAPRGLLAEFTDAAALVRATRAARAAGYAGLDAFAPYPLPALEGCLAADAAAIDRAGIAGVLLGVLAALGLQWLQARDLPVNVGGWPPFAPGLAWVLALFFGVLGGAAGALGMLLYRCGLPRLHHPLFEVADFQRASDDAFFLYLEAADLDAARAWLQARGALHVREVPA